MLAVAVQEGSAPHLWRYAPQARLWAMKRGFAARARQVSRGPILHALRYFQPAEEKGQACGVSHRSAATGFISITHTLRPVGAAGTPRAPSLHGPWPFPKCLILR